MQQIVFYFFVTFSFRTGFYYIVICAYCIFVSMSDLVICSILILWREVTFLSILICSSGLPNNAWHSGVTAHNTPRLKSELTFDQQNLRSSFQLIFWQYAGFQLNFIFYIFQFFLTDWIQHNLLHIIMHWAPSHWLDLCEIPLLN